MADLRQTLQRVRALLEGFDDPEARGITAPVMREVDRALGLLEPEIARTLPLAQTDDAEPEVVELRREVNRLQTLLKTSEGQSLQQQLLDAVLEQSPHGVIVCNAEGALILRSKAADRIWAGSATADNVEQWGKYRAFHPDGRPYEPADWAMTRSLQHGEIIHREYVHIQRFDGTHGIILGSCAPLMSREGKILGAVGVFADVTEYKMVERLKDRWVAVAGHEMRRPLTVIKFRTASAIAMLDEGRVAEARRMLGVIEEANDHLSSMVSDMLDISRLQGGTLGVQRERVALKPLIEKVVAGATADGYEIVLEIPEVKVVCDALRTSQVLANILGNAIRYSRPSTIRLEVVREGESALVRVRDQGVGMVEEELERVFEPFVRVNSQGDEGLGLGLYLAREFVTRMGGRIWAESEGLGKGSVFCFTLPLAPA